MKTKTVSMKDVLNHPDLSLSPKDYMVQIVIDTELTLQEISDILVTAFEGGINYWCGKVEIVKPPPDGLPFEFASDVVGLGGKLKLHDLEDEDDVWFLDLEILRNGIGKYCATNGVIPSKMLEDMDAYVADDILQYSLFGNIVFA